MHDPRTVAAEVEATTGYKKSTLVTKSPPDFVEERQSQQRRTESLKAFIEKEIGLAAIDVRGSGSSNDWITLSKSSGVRSDQNTYSLGLYSEDEVPPSAHEKARVNPASARWMRSLKTTARKWTTKIKSLTCNRVDNE